jgi:hypothetical protein
MKIYKNPLYQFIFFLIIFFVINALQSNYTALFEDEAYYWMWSKNLAFGYFDHPPLVALWIKISSFFFSGELGVRFFSGISFSLMLVIIWLIIDYKEKWNYVGLFFLLVVSMALLNIFGFVTTPDTPLLLFVALFLLSYKNFLENENWVNTLFLGISMAAMLYSKYHGVLVILFIILSNLSLLRRKKFWVAGIICILIFLPHLYWQYENGFPSFVYHLKERGKKLYSIENTIMYLVNLIAIVGITFPVIYKAFFKQKPQSTFDKSLQFLIYGFIVFFFFSTFASRPQAQWTGIILIPLIILTFPYFIKNKKERKWLLILGSIQLLIIMLGRIFLANEYISPIQLEPHMSGKWVSRLEEKTKSKPIVFVNSYKNASVYEFYTGIKTHSYSVLKGRKSQYDLLDFEKEMQNKDIYGVGKFLKDAPFLVEKDGDSLNGFPIDNYTTFQKVTCTIEQDQLDIKKGDDIDFQFNFTNTYNKNITFKNVKFIGVFQGYKNKILSKVPLRITDLHNLENQENYLLQASFRAPELEMEEKVTFRVAIQFYDLLEGYQGNKVNVKFKN